MNKYIFIYFLLAFAQVSVGQTIFSGTETFENSTHVGFYISIQSEKKFIDEEWKTYLSKFGSVKQEDDNFIIKNALFEQISRKSMSLYSKISLIQKYQSKLFVSIDSLNSSEKNRVFIEKMLKDYYQYSLRNEEQRFIENELATAKNQLEELERKLAKNQKKFKRAIKNDEKLSKNIDQAQEKIQNIEEKNLSKDIANSYAFQESKKETSSDEATLEKNKKKLKQSITRKTENSNKKEQLLEDEAKLQQMITEAERKLAEVQKNVSQFKTKQI